MRTRTTRKRFLLRLEALESRHVLATDAVHNFLTPHDVNDDLSVTSIDALVVINEINDRIQGRPNAPAVAGIPRLLDVNDDSSITAIDALQVINRLNRDATSQPATGPAGQIHEAYVTGVKGVRAKVEYEVEGVQAELSVRLQGAEANTSYAVQLNDLALGELLTDARGRGKLVLSTGADRGDHLPLPPEFTGLTADSRLVIEGLIDSLLGRRPSDPSSGGDDQDRPGDDDSEGDDDHDDSAGNSVELVARFAPLLGVTREAEYEVELRQGVTVREFEIEIEHAPAGSTFDVLVDGTWSFTLTADTSGKAKLKLSTSPTDTDETLMPADFPQIVLGTLISIGGIESQFETDVD